MHPLHLFSQAHFAAQVAVTRPHHDKHGEDSEDMAGVVGRGPWAVGVVTPAGRTTDAQHDAETNRWFLDAT